MRHLLQSTVSNPLAVLPYVFILHCFCFTCLSAIACAGQLSIHLLQSSMHISSCKSSDSSSRSVRTAPNIRRFPYSELSSNELLPIEPRPHRTAVCLIEISPLAVMLSASQYSLGASDGTGTAMQLYLTSSSFASLSSKSSIEELILPLK